MTDRELLELAAKAAGIALKPMQINNVTEQGDDRFIGYITDPEQCGRGWFNPLTDDGDALRLEVDTNITTKHRFLEILAEENDLCNGDYRKARRRAIVRAVAEIGEGME